MVSIKNLVFVIFIVLFSGCFKQPEINEYSSKEFQNVNKDAILNAAKTLIKLSDSEFQIDSKRTSLKASKITPIYKGYTVDINLNTVELFVYPDDTTTKARVKFTHQKSILDEKSKVITGEVHTLFWQRLEYLLGLNKDWYTCSEYRMKLNFDGIFCNVMHNENKIPQTSDILTNIGFKEKTEEKAKVIEQINIDLNDMLKIQLPISNSSSIESNITRETNSSILDDLNISEITNDDINTTPETNSTIQ
jgi:hypothetical protein